MDTSLLGSLTQFNLYTGSKSSCMQYCCGSGSGLRWQCADLAGYQMTGSGGCHSVICQTCTYYTPTILLLSVNSWRTDSSIYDSSMR